MCEESVNQSDLEWKAYITGVSKKKFGKIFVNKEKARLSSTSMAPFGSRGETIEGFFISVYIEQ